MTMLPDVCNECTSIEEVIARHRMIEKSSQVNCLGHTFSIWPEVFSPFIAPSGYLEVSFAGWRIFENKSVLDIGSGSGVSSCLFALNGARNVVGVDINPRAIEAGKANAKLVGVESHVTFVEGDVFDSVDRPEDFDIIFANLPFTSGQPADMLERAFFDPGLSSIKKYLRQISDILEKNSTTRAFVCVSDLENHDLPQYSASVLLEWKDAMTIDLGWVKLALVELHRVEERSLRA